MKKWQEPRSEEVLQAWEEGESPQDQAFPSHLSLNKDKPATAALLTVSASLLFVLEANPEGFKVRTCFSSLVNYRLTKYLICCLLLDPSWKEPCLIPSRADYFLEGEQRCAINATLAMTLSIYIAAALILPAPPASRCFLCYSAHLRLRFVAQMKVCDSCEPRVARKHRC